MRLRYKINEESNLDRLVDVLFRVINDCQPYLKQMGTVNPPQFMYSGRKSMDPWFERDVRADRKPVDMFHEIHKDLDDAFNKRFGWRPRSNGLFCTGNIYDAEEYGRVYTIFPKGDFKVIWSESIGDLYISLQDKAVGVNGIKRSNGLKEKLTQEFKYQNSLNHYPWSPEQVQDKVSEKYQELISGVVDEYRSGQVMKAIGSWNEIMLNCKSYYAINWRLFFGELRDFFKEYRNNYDMTMSDIKHLIAYKG